MGQRSKVGGGFSKYSSNTSSRGRTSPDSRSHWRRALVMLVGTFGGSVAQWLSSLVAWWLGGLVAWWRGGVVARWRGGNPRVFPRLPPTCRAGVAGGAIQCGRRCLRYPGAILGESGGPARAPVEGVKIAVSVTTLRMIKVEWRSRVVCAVVGGEVARGWWWRSRVD